MAQAWARAFYKSRQWQEAREYIIARDNHMCVRCGDLGKEVHHKIHLSQNNIGDPNITLNPNNLELLCGKCHRDEHNNERNNSRFVDDGKRETAERIQRTYVFDTNGMLVPRDTPL